MKLFRENKYLGRKTSGMLALLLTCGILSGCLEEDFTNNSINQNEIVGVDDGLYIEPEEDFTNNSINQNEIVGVDDGLYIEAEEEFDSSLSYSDKLSDEYVSSEIDKLDVMDEVTVNGAGFYYTLCFTDSNGEEKVMVTYTRGDYEGDQYIAKIYDAFTKVIIFKYPCEYSTIFDIDVENICYTIPFFENCTINSYKSIIGLKSFALRNGLSSDYVNLLMAYPFDTSQHFYTDLEVAELYVRLIDEKYRVTAEEIYVGLDMEDPKIKVLK